MPPLDDAITALQNEVTDTVGVEESAVALINSMATQIAAVANDPQAILDTVAKFKASADALAAAVAANSPAPAAS
jgi:hypothetical protein